MLQVWLLEEFLLWPPFYSPVVKVYSTHNRLLGLKILQLISNYFAANAGFNSVQNKSALAVSTENGFVYCHNVRKDKR